jgi:hypothetical protein
MTDPKTKISSTSQAISGEIEFDDERGDAPPNSEISVLIPQFSVVSWL